MDMNNLYIAIALIAAFGFYIIYTYSNSKTKVVDTVYEDLVSENDQLKKKAVALEQKVEEDALVIEDLLTQKRSYETMDRYITHLENTIKTLTTENDQEETPNE